MCASYYSLKRKLRNSFFDQHPVNKNFQIYAQAGCTGFKLARLESRVATDFEIDISKSLANLRILLCKKLMADMKNESLPISFLVPQVTIRTIQCYTISLKIKKHCSSKHNEKDKRVNDFFAFRFA